MNSSGSINFGLMTILIVICSTIQYIDRAIILRHLNKKNKIVGTYYQNMVFKINVATSFVYILHVH